MASDVSSDGGVARGAAGVVVDVAVAAGEEILAYYGPSFWEKDSSDEVHPPFHF